MVARAPPAGGRSPPSAGAPCAPRPARATGTPAVRVEPRPGAVEVVAGEDQVARADLVGRRSRSGPPRPGSRAGAAGPRSRPSGFAGPAGRLQHVREQDPLAGRDPRIRPVQVAAGDQQVVAGQLVDRRARRSRSARCSRTRSAGPRRRAGPAGDPGRAQQVHRRHGLGRRPATGGLPSRSTLVSGDVVRVEVVDDDLVRVDRRPGGPARSAAAATSATARPVASAARSRCSVVTGRRVQPRLRAVQVPARPASGRPAVSVTPSSVRPVAADRNPNGQPRHDRGAGGPSSPPPAPGAPATPPRPVRATATRRPGRG